MLRIITPAASHDLLSLDEAKATLGIIGSAQDATIAALVAAVSASIGRYCGQRFGRETVEQVERDAYGLRGILLERSVAPSIVSIVENDDAPLAVDEWELDGRLLRRLMTSTCVRWYAVAVTVRYSAGAATLVDLPAEIAQAARATLAAWWSARGRDPALQREIVEGVGSVFYATPPAADGALPFDATALLAPYRLLGF